MLACQRVSALKIFRSKRRLCQKMYKVNGYTFTGRTFAGLPPSGKYLENEFFSRSGTFVAGQGNLERTWKVREKSGNLKINGYGRQSSENLFILFKRGKDVHSREIVKVHLPQHWGLLLKERIGEQILSFKSNPQIRSDSVNTIKGKKDFFDLSEDMENCKMSGNNQGKVREF